MTTAALGDMKRPSLFARALRGAGLDPSRVAGGRQVHGRRVREVRGPAGFEGLPSTDGVATGVPGLALRVYAADCAPVFVLDPARRGAALVHAGWRGTEKRILARTLDALKKRGSRPRDLWVAVGPHIRPCCYEVGPEVARRFPGAAARRGERFSLDVSAALRRQALRAGVKGGRFVPSSHCTCHDRRFFSFRREKTERRMAAILALTPYERKR